MFKCPTCRTRLLRVQGPIGFSYVCPRCRGRAVSLSVVRRAAGQDCVRQLWIEKGQKAAVSGKKCPVCDHWMREVPISVARQVLRLDLCRPCQFVWFDPKEFEAIATAPPKPAKPELPLEAREKMALAEIKSLEERERLRGGFLEGEMGGVGDLGDLGDEGPEEHWKWIPGVLGLPVPEEFSPLRSLPWITWGLAAILVLVFVLTANRLESAVEAYGLIPAQFFGQGMGKSFTSFFLHANFWHLVVNVYFLVIFGDYVEDYLGRWRYAALLVAAALAGDLLHVLFEPRVFVPTIGASGGISGIIVFYGLQFPRARLGILVRYFYLFRWLYLPAWMALLAWFGLQLVWAGLQVSGLSNVSALAHIGGAVTGLVAWFAWRRRV
jgi:membrane associated rhomboid family serine protease/Zn-finger nucleic acid-binding protein